MALSDSLKVIHHPLAKPTLSIESQATAFKRKHDLHSVSSRIEMLYEQEDAAGKQKAAWSQGSPFPGYML